MTMKRPMGLCGEGRRAWEIALDAINDDEKLYFAACRYAEAVDMQWRAKRAWIRRGKPMVETAVNGVTGKSPHLKAWEDARREVAAAGAAIGIEKQQETRKPGRPLGATTRAATAPPVLKLAKRKDQDVG